jgi:hypothetical protein
MYLAAADRNARGLTESVNGATGTSSTRPLPLPMPGSYHRQTQW